MSVEERRDFLHDVEGDADHDQQTGTTHQHGTSATRQANRASTGAIGRVLVLPWAAILFLMIFGGGFPRFESVLVASILIRAFVDYVMFFIYYSNLHQEFRKLAANESRTPSDYNQDFGLLNDPLN